MEPTPKVVYLTYEMFFCLITALLWGLWTVCLKQATRFLPPLMVQLLMVCLNVTLVPFYLYFLRGRVISPTEDLQRGLFWVILSVIFVSTGSLFNLSALSRMDAGVVTGIVSMAPAVTLLVQVATRQEALTLTKGLGMFFVVVGVVVLSV